MTLEGQLDQRVSVSLPGADVLVPQESKPSSGLGWREVTLHGID